MSTLTLNEDVLSLADFNLTVELPLMTPGQGA